MKLNMLLERTFFENVDPRRKQERADGRMVSEDHSQMANLSRRPVHREFDAWRDVERFDMFDQSENKR